MSIVSRGVATPADGRPSRERPNEPPSLPRGVADDPDPVDPPDELELPPPDEPDDPDDPRGDAVLPVLDPGGAVRCPDEDVNSELLRNVGVSGTLTSDELLLEDPTVRSLLPPPEPVVELDPVVRGAAVSPELVELDELEAVRCAAARAGTAKANATANGTRLRGEVAMVNSLKGLRSS